MRSRLWLLLIALGLSGTALPSAQARDEIARGDVVVVPMDGEISPSLFFFLRRAQKTAESKGASALIIELNTYGGRLDTAEEVTKLLNRATIPTYTFINTNAGSAGALIALATQHIYMAPVSAIGAAAPVLASGRISAPPRRTRRSPIGRRWSVEPPRATDTIPTSAKRS